jgi:hypothetical protein
MARPSTPREIRSLNGTWRIAFDSEDSGRQERWYEKFPAKTEPIRVPSVWNVIRPNYQGVAWYQTSFSAPAAWQDKSVRIRFGAVNYLAEVWLNGKFLGSHEGGYTPFEVEASDAVRGNAENQLIVRVLVPPFTRGSLQRFPLQPLGALKQYTEYARDPIEGFDLEEVPASKQTWWGSFGGPWQDVDLVATSRVWVQDCFVQPDIHAQKVAVQCQVSNQTGQEAQLTLKLTARGKNEPATRGIQESKEVTIERGGSRLDLSLSIPKPKLWSPERPSLYTLRASLLRQGKPIDTREFTFGMREFTVRENHFYLNDRLIVLRGALYQPHYPETLAYPPTETWLAEELRLAKGANLNLLRLHIKTQVPRLLELADAQGMLLLEEPPIAWIKESPQMRERCRREVEELVRRDRNHPALVMWGMLNESGFGAQKIKSELMALAHELDPTRPVLDDSGSGEKAQMWMPQEPQPRALFDVHPYKCMPFDRASFDYYRQLSQPNRLNFISEYGALGGIEDLPAVIRRYPPGRAWQDKGRLQEVNEMFRKGFLKSGLDKFFGNFSAFTQSSQEAQAEALARMTDALRLNPAMGGYIITQFRDVMTELSFGLMDEWKQMKPAYAAAAEANKPLHLIVSPSHSDQYAEEDVEVELTVVNEAGKSGAGQINLQVNSADGKVLNSQKRQATLGARVQSLGSLRLPAPANEGTYRLVGSLILGGKILDRNEQTILVLKRPNRQAGPVLPIALFDPDEHWAPRLSSFPLQVSAYNPELLPQKVYVVGPLAASLSDYPLAQLKGVMDLVRQGATLIIDELPGDTTAVAERFGVFPIPVSMAAMGEYMIMASHWIRDHELTSGLPSNLVLDQRYAEVLPRFLLDKPDNEAIGGAVVIHYFQPKWFPSLVVAPVEKGHIIFCQFRLFENLGKDPVADRLFMNLVRYADSIATVPAAGLTPARQKELEQEVADARKKTTGETKQ